MRYTIYQPTPGRRWATQTTRFLAFFCLLMADFRSVASGCDNVGPSPSSTTIARTSHTPPSALAASSRSALGELDANTDPSAIQESRQQMKGSSRSRLKAELVGNMDTLCETWAKRTKLSVEDVQHVAAEVFIKEKVPRTIVKAKCETYHREKQEGQAANVQAFHNCWRRLSTPGTVSSSVGSGTRRVLSASVSGPGTSYEPTRKFLGGDFSRKAFYQAQERNADSFRKKEISILAGKRQPRSDRMEVKWPRTLEHIAESIEERTQPSPSASKVKHDFSKGNHSRSDVDNSLVCENRELCKTEPVRFIIGTRGDLFTGVMRDVEDAWEKGLVETNAISRTSFDKLLPFYVVEQSLRSCLCVHCYRAKLLTIALCEQWQTLHQGATPGSACTCECDLCKDGGCATFLPYTSAKTVNSMANLCDLLMCPKELLYYTQDGTPVEAHRSACVSGHCPKCRRKQDRLFGCPQNRGDAQRQVHPTPLNNDSSPASPSERQPGIITWFVFTTVDYRGQATTSDASARRRRRQQGDVDGDDDDYDPAGGANQNRQRKAVAERRGTVDDLFRGIREILKVFVKHRRQYKTQRVAFKELKATLVDGHVVLVVDFQERLSIHEQDEVQSQHWDHEATTIFPCPIFIKLRGRVWAYSFQVLSNDMAQDNAWVQHVMSKLLNDHIPALLRKIGADPMTRATIYTDNCAKQFKCRFHFGWVADSGVMIRDNDGEPTNERLRIEHHYFGACHGKNISDSEGGITKTYARDQVTNQAWRVSSPRDLCEKLAKGLSFIYREPTEEERVAFYDCRAHDRGSGQILVTKTSSGEVENTEQTKTFLLDKKINTVFGREFLYVDVDEMTADVRNRARSSTKEVHVAGCHGVSKVVATDTPGVLAAYTLSCYCPECLANRQDMCPLIRQGIITGPTEFSRRVGPDDECFSDKDVALELLFLRMKTELPFGSTALVRVEPSEYRGHDIVPVIIARKGPILWSSEYSRDGMFTQGDIMVWVYDLTQIPSSVWGQGVEYVVPAELANDRLRAIPLTCVAGLGQGLEGYMQRSSLPTALSEQTSNTFILREGVLENARSNVVRMSIHPSSAFNDFQPAALSDEDLVRAPVKSLMFPKGTVFQQGFKSPVMANRQRKWRGNLMLTAEVVHTKTDRKSRRHRYQLKWGGTDKMALSLAGVPKAVDEGYIERSKRV